MGAFDEAVRAMPAGDRRAAVIRKHIEILRELHASEKVIGIAEQVLLEELAQQEAVKP